MPILKVTCCDCQSVDYLDAVLTDEQQAQFRCQHCEKQLYYRNLCKAALHSPDPVNHPQHYKGKGLEAIQVIEAFDLGFNLGNAIKYLLRCDKKGNKVQDLKKAIWYINREIERLELEDKQLEE
jgi:hypothetical protein